MTIHVVFIHIINGVYISLLALFSAVTFVFQYDKYVFTSNSFALEQVMSQFSLHELPCRVLYCNKNYMLIIMLYK